MMCESPWKSGRGNSRKDPALREGEEQQRQSTACLEGQQDPKELCRNSQILKVTLGQMDGVSVLSPHSRSGNGSHFPEFAAELRDEAICDNIVGCVMDDKYPRGFELRVEGAASPPSSFLETLLIHHSPSEQEEGSALPAAGHPKCVILPALKFLFSASASAWEKELILLSRVSFSFRIESCWRCWACCQRPRAGSVPRNISSYPGRG